MHINIPQAVHSLIGEYRRFLNTSCRFPDGHLKKRFESHPAWTDVIVKGPYVTLAHDFGLGHSLRELADSGRLDPEVLKAHCALGEGRLFFHQE